MYSRSFGMSKCYGGECLVWAGDVCSSVVDYFTRLHSSIYVAVPCLLNLVMFRMPKVVKSRIGEKQITSVTTM